MLVPRSTLAMATSSIQLSDSYATGTIPPPLPTDWHGQAISMFSQDYVVTSRTSIFDTGYLQIVPSLYASEKEMSALSQAVSAVALTSVAHRTRLDRLSAQARQRYGLALKLLREAMSDQKMVKSDSCLAAILLLDFYEVGHSGECEQLSLPCISVLIYTDCEWREISPSIKVLLAFGWS